MPLMTDEVASQLKDEFAQLQNPVRLAVFSQALADPESEQVRRLVEELAATSPLLSVESYNFVLDKEKVEALGIPRIPAIAVLGADKDYGIRFYGLPSGYEFGTLVEAILDVSRGDSGLSEETRTALKELAKPVHLQVFSTPTCPYCPRAVRMAFRFAIESDLITADGVEVTGYPDLAQKYRVSSVPKTVVGETAEFVGAGPESLLLKHVQQAANGGSLIV
jgi:glutaredoxin-like protein